MLWIASKLYGTTVPFSFFLYKKIITREKEKTIKKRTLKLWITNAEEQLDPVQVLNYILPGKLQVRP